MKTILPIAAVLGAFFLLQNWQAVAGRLGGGIDYDPVLGGEVVLYATSWCGYCRKTRALLKANGVDYTEFDIENSADGARRFKQLGGRGVPVVTVGRQVIHGYNPGALKAALQAGVPASR